MIEQLPRADHTGVIIRELDQRGRFGFFHPVPVSPFLRFRLTSPYLRFRFFGWNSDTVTNNWGVQNSNLSLARFMMAAVAKSNHARRRAVLEGES